ncbi:VOC family protein [Kineosporia mesophila]|uniref:VOC family protein n=1 Tax=Kineosporia mesophila TaxID=566012 RepID=A0ABP7A8H6_9ACTN|nr:VOC family protein [Kineosporia mesophila]MCD5354598.1 hypothetical protein [Kineosporia mesophila]
MTAQLVALCFDTEDPARLAGFWAGFLGWEVRDGTTAYAPAALDPGFVLRFLPTDEPKTAPNQMHFDLTSSSLDDQRQTVERALALGARHHDVGQRPEEGHVVLADPGGNEFCVIEPGNRFLAGTGAIGALAGDGSQATGYFWSQVLDWPLVWDQDEETAIRSPRGGPKITWGGPPVAPRTGRRYRPHFDIAPAPGTGRPAELERLIGLGATVRTSGQLADPDGHEFCLL